MANRLDLVARFAPEERQRTPPSFDAIASDSTATAWERFWLSGAAIDFAGTTDPRALELERRVVLSQYLTAVQLGRRDAAGGDRA